MKYGSSLVKLLLVIFTIAAITGCIHSSKKRDRYLIPNDFYGTVYVHYNVQNAEPLKMEDGFRLVIIPHTGIVHTSSEFMEGEGHREYYDEYWLYSGDQRVKMSPYKMGGGATVHQSGQQERTWMFQVLKEERPHDTLWSILTTW